MMFNLQKTMNLLLLVFPLIWFEATFGVRSEPKVIIVEEGSDVTLPCSHSSKESIVFTLFEWKKDGQKEVFGYDSDTHSNNGRPGQDEQFRGRVSHFPDGLKSGNAAITIRNTKVADSGNYTCDFPQLQPRQIFHIKLHVGAAPKPYVRILKQTENWALLQCEVRGASPKPKLHWQDSDGNNLHAEEPKVTERGGSYDVILNITVTKTDYYRCVATQEEIKHQIQADIFVYIHGPNVITVKEGSDVILPCSLSSNKRIEFFDWKKDGQKKVFMYDAGIHSNEGGPGQDEQFKGRVSHFPDGLKSGKAPIKIKNMKVADRGNYTCEFPQFEPKQIFHIKLHVGGDLKDRTAENIKGSAPKPYVTSLQTNDWALLQCEVRDAFPKPELHWEDSDGNILHAKEPKVTERGGSYDVILQTTVTKTDYYRCVVTQEEISHQIYTETYVSIKFPTGWIILLVLLVVVGVFLVVLIWKGYITINGKKGPCSRRTVAAIFIGLLVPVVGVVALAVLIWKGYITINGKKDSPPQPSEVPLNGLHHPEENPSDVRL